MVTLGAACLIMGVAQAIAWLWTTGAVLVVIGLLGWMLAVAGHRAGGRRIRH